MDSFFITPLSVTPNGVTVNWQPRGPGGDVTIAGVRAVKFRAFALARHDLQTSRQGREVGEQRREAPAVPVP